MCGIKNFLAAAAIFTILPVLAQSQANFTALIYDEFGANNGPNVLLNYYGLTELYHQVLNGQTYNTHANVCAESNCSSTVVSNYAMRDLVRHSNIRLFIQSSENSIMIWIFYCNLQVLYCSDV